MQKATTGVWADYEAILRTAAARHAPQGASLASWHRITGALEARILPLLVRAWQDDPPRMIAALQAKRTFFHRSMAILGDALLKRSQGVMLQTRALAAQHALELARSEARKNSIVDAALDAIVTIDHESRILEFNRAAELVFGRSRDDVVGRDLAEVII